MKVFITGSAGTGKTHVLSELQKLGFLVIDLDATGICRWRNDKTGEFTEYGMQGRDSHWLSEHGWYCDVPRLRNLLQNISDDKYVFVAGITDNFRDVAKEFNKVFLLSADEKTLRQRLTNRTNNNFGKKRHEQDVILGGASKLKDSLDDFILIDANQSLDKVAQSILQNLLSKK